jgi:olfactory receptor
LQDDLLDILATLSDSHLHMPMYFFLSNLSYVEICLTSTIIPKMLVNILTQRKAINYKNFNIQIYFFIHFMGLDIGLLTVIGNDHFVAICHSLYYTVIMKHQLWRLQLWCPGW